MNYILFFCMLFCLSCGNNSSQVEENIMVKSASGTGVFEDYFYTEKLVPLETNEKCLIGTLSLVKETKSKNIVVVSNLWESSSEFF